MKKMFLKKMHKTPILTSFVAFASAALFLGAGKTFAEDLEPYVKIWASPPSVKLSEPPKLDDKESFSMILFGDPQNYMKFDFNQPIFEYMTAWAAAQKERLNVKTVLCTGDLVEQNDIAISCGGNLYGGKRCGNQPSSLQWKAVSRAFERLDNIYPYVLCTGNHDYGYDSSETRSTRFTEFFDVSRNNKQWGRHLVAAYPNASGRASLENAAYEFIDKNWKKILIISLEFSPRNEVLEWAKKLCSKEAFAKHTVILLTHSILTKDGEVIEKEGYKNFANSGKDILEKLAFQCPNVKLAICGHTGSSKIMGSFRIEKNADEKKLPIMMFNAQTISGGEGNGGDGWLRILEFKPDGKTITVKTYSPLFAFSKKTENLAWEKSPEHNFDIVIDR